MSASPAPFEVREATASDVGAAGRVVAAAYLNDLRVSDGYVAHLRDAGARAQLAVLQTVKDALDPQGILNPGKLGLRHPFAEVRWP